MDRRTLFIKGLQAKRYEDRVWVLSVLTVPETTTGDTKPFCVQVRDGQLYTLNEAGEEEPIEGVKANEPICVLRAPIEITKDDVPNATGKVTTTYGRVLYNALVILPVLSEHIEFMNEEVKVMDIINRAIDLLDSNKITVADLWEVCRLVFNTSTYTPITTTAATPKTVVGTPAAVKRKNELIAQNKDQLDRPDVVAKIEAEVIKMDRDALKGDESEDYFLGTKSFNVARKKNFIMHGAEEDFVDPSKVKTITNSLDDGWDLDDLPEIATSIVMGSYSRGVETQLGGVIVKVITRSMQNVTIRGDDCKSKMYYKMLLRPTIAKLFIGRTISVNGKLILLDKDNIKNYEGKVVQLRSPLYCKMPYTDFCKTCVGTTVGASEQAAAMLTADVGSTIMLASMAKMHAKALSVKTYNYEDCIS